MPRTPSTADRKDINFTVKLAPSQLRFLESLKPALRVQSEQGSLREVLDQFQSWFRLPPYQRERLEQDMAGRRVNLLQYLQELLALRFEELRSTPAPADAPALPPRVVADAPEMLEDFNVRIAPALLAYADKLKPELHKGSTAEVIRELVDHLQEWFHLPRYQAERLHQDMAARGLQLIEYVRERLARRYEVLRDQDGPPAG
jgi:hypothetical protein